ncbi:hypothetical protein QAD02_004650 [Eretmocerus hayati]|uniref:Uncharacterized protein n=1 Tax=Eretmocerus hayati TaxID=131215 RepID=A0ACC2NQC5_9HYME|nr:hypothetical protein QAD02_004650 [Eretmocerus hayati]
MSVVQFRDLKAVRLFLNLGIDLKKCEKSDPPILQRAAKNRCTEVLDYLLSRRILDPSNADENTVTALYVAAESVNPRAMELLLEAGAKVDPVNHRDGFTPLHQALSLATVRWYSSKIEDEIAHCIELLLSYGADVEAEMYGGNELETSEDGGVVQYRLDYSKICGAPLKVLLSHVNLLLSQGRRVDTKLYQEMKNYDEACQNELETLKTEILGEPVSLYHVLTGGFCKFYTRYSGVMQNIQDCEHVSKLKDRFPIYGRRVVKYIDHQILMEKAAGKLSRLLGLQKECFHLIIEKIILMLHKRDMQVLSIL